MIRRDFRELKHHAPVRLPQGSRHGLKKGMYLIPSALTTASIGAGYYAIINSLQGFQLVGRGTVELSGAAEHFNHAAVFILWACLFDALDGRIARLTKTTSEIGVHLDSLADVLAFGIAPAVLVYAWGYGAALGEGSNLQKLGTLCSFMYLVCGAFRLARFNVQATRPRVLAEGSMKLDKKSFVGMPIPVAAGSIAALVHFTPGPLIAHGSGTAVIYSSLMMALTAILSMLMVSTLRYPSFKSIESIRGSMRLAILLVAGTGMLVWLFSRYVLLTLFLAYAAYGIVLKSINLVRRCFRLGSDVPA